MEKIVARTDFEFCEEDTEELEIPTLIHDHLGTEELTDDAHSLVMLRAQTTLASNVHGHPMNSFTSVIKRQKPQERGEKKPKRTVKSAEAAAATPRKVQNVPLDDIGQPVLPFTIGVVTLNSLGAIVWDRAAYHNKRYIWPVGMHTSRIYQSCLHADRQTIFHSCILDGGPAPLFDVYAEDEPEQHYQSSTPTGAWTAIVKQANAIRGRDYQNSASGPDFFGLSNATISMLIERLPEAERCTSYQRKSYELAQASRISVPSKRASSLKNTSVPDSEQAELLFEDENDNSNIQDEEQEEEAEEFEELQ